MSPTNMDNPNIYNPNTNYSANYQNAAAQTSGAQANLANYQKTMQDPGQMYGQNLANAQQMYGFDPKALGVANQNLARTQTVMANLPQAVQQQGAYYGTTAGSEANNYAQQEGNLQPVLAGQTNAVGAYQNELAATQQQAQQQAQLSYQGQQLQMSGYQDQVANALGFQNAAQAQQAGYGQYVTSVAQARAAQESASAQMLQAQVAQSEQQQQLNTASSQQAWYEAMTKAAQQGAQQQAPATSQFTPPNPAFGPNGYMNGNNIAQTFTPNLQSIMQGAGGIVGNMAGLPGMLAGRYLGGKL